MPKVYSEFYGCSANAQDAAIMLGLLKQAGYEKTENPGEADVNLITTCVVKTPTEHRMIHRIRELSKTNKPLIVAGCMANTETDVISKLNPAASLIGPNSIQKIVEVADATLRGERKIVLENLKQEKTALPHVRMNPIVDIVEISSGCLSHCTFCQTKLARGDLVSYRPNSIREQIKQALNEDCKEIWLTSQDSSAYGRDIGTNLADLIETVSKIDGKFFVRVGMMNPLHFKKVELQKVVHAFKHEKIFKFLHLCVQSGSNKVLQDMRRGYTAEDFISYVAEFRKEIPEITLETDIIVGFPTETEEDFGDTVDLLKIVKPDVVNVSKYGARPGTYSAKKLKQLPAKVVNERSKILHELVRKISRENNSKWIGWTGEAIVDEKINEGVIARNFSYKPIVIKENVSLGEFIHVKILDAKENFLLGKILH